MTISGNEANWQEFWDSGATAWDLGGPHPLFGQVMSILNSYVPWPEMRNWYVGGCGRAHDAAAIARRGANVVATDIVEQAIVEAKAQYHDLENLSLTVADTLIVKSDEIGRFDAVFDRAMLCAMTGEARKAYVDSCHARLRRSGFFVSIPFAKVADSVAGPPFEISEVELRELFGTGWTISILKRRLDGAVNQRILEEFLFIAKKANY